MTPEEVAACWEGNAEAWTRLVRAGHDRYRDALNTPAFLAMLPSIAGLPGLDIGCGEGANTRALARLGARMTGIDVARTFVRHAQEAEADAPLGIDYRVADAATLPFADERFAFATAFMSLMDMPDQPAVLAEARRVLAPGGFLQFSILHPCFVPPRHRNVRDADGRVVALEIGGYFEELDGEIETWIFSTVPPEERAAIPPFRTPRFHRTLSRWVEMVVSAGFLIEAMGEPRATEEAAAAEPVVADTRNAPIFLHVRCRKAR